MRVYFDEQLTDLHKQLIDMGKKCEKAIETAVEAIFDETSDVAENFQAVTNMEKEINDMERSIEALCMSLLLKQQPVAGDLRMVSSAMKMISDMERIGDQSLDIVEMAEYIRTQEISSKTHLKAMASGVTKMVNNSITAFVKKDLDLAKRVILYDDVVDGLFDKIKRELVDILASGDKEGEMFIDLLMIAKYLERVGDHATNIAESVEFYLTGNRVFG